MKPLWERLSQEERQVLAFKWIDQSIREDLAHMCEREGEPEVLNFSVPNIARSCFMRVMTSRFVYGDDRLVKTMENDLVQN